MYVDRKRVFDDIYNTFYMISGGRYISVYDAQTQVTHWCPDALRVFGLPSEYFDQGAYNWENVIHPDDVQLYRDCMLNLTLGKISNYDLSYRCRIFDGSYILCHHKGIVIRNENGTPNFIGGLVLEDSYLNRHCPLTGLRNFEGFSADIKETAETKSPKNILILGINDFGKINDGYGFEFGNRFIRKFAGLLRKGIGEMGEVYRVEDVKFAIMSDEIEQGELDELLNRINRELNDGFIVDGILIKANVSGSAVKLDRFDASPADIKEHLYDILRESKQG